MISDPQQRYYRLCLTILSEHTGYLNKELHEEVKRMFMIDTVHKMDSKDFPLFIEKFYAWAVAYHNCRLPDPKKEKAV